MEAEAEAEANLVEVNEFGMDVLEDSRAMKEPYGIPCMMEIFHFLCSLLDIGEQIWEGRKLNPIAFDEDVPLFALGLINSAIEVGGASMRQHPQLLALVQDELFYNLMQLGLSKSPLVISTVCSIVLNLYHQLRLEIKLQIEAFFSCVLLRLAQGRYGASYQQQEVAMEALVDFCRQKDFVAEMYANLDCDIRCGNVFEEIANLLCKSAFPVNGPLSSMQVVALDGLIAVIQGMSDRMGNIPPPSQQTISKYEQYTPFWTVQCENYSDPEAWVSFVRQRKYLKKQLMLGADHFNKNPKNGLEFLQKIHLLPPILDPNSVGCFLRYTPGLDKNLIGEYLGNHGEFCIQVLHEFAGTFDFEGMSMDTALRLFLETFRLPGESQKIQRVLEAFSDRYYEQSPHILANKDAALLLSYSLIMLNTDQHNVQVKKKMAEEDFIRNNRGINGGSDLPRKFLSELYHSICRNEIRTIPEQGVGVPEMTRSRWIDLMQKSKKTSPYIVCESRPFLDRDMFAIMADPTVAAISVVFEYAEHEEVLISCTDGFLAVAKLCAWYHLPDVLDDLVVSVCKFTALLDISSLDELVIIFEEDVKARMATETLFSIVNKYGDCIRISWKNVLDCIIRLHKLGLLPARVVSDTSYGSDLSTDGKPSSPISKPAAHVRSMSVPRRPSGLMGRFSQLLYLDTEETSVEPTEEELASHQKIRQIIQKCHIDSIFAESKFLHADSLLQLSRALISAAGRPQNITISTDDEDTSVFCLELLIAITLNNRDRIGPLWKDVYEHIANIVQSTVMPCALVEKAVFGLLRICQRLLPYKEDLVDDLLRSLQLILKLDARVADAYCENITQEVTSLVKANVIHIRSQIGWRTIASLLSITARHPEGSEVGFEALVFIMSEGTHLSPSNFVLCIEASRQFAESRVGLEKRSIHALDLMAGSVTCLTRWSLESRETGEEAEKILEGINEMWLRLVQALKRVCLDQREQVRNHAVSSLQRCMVGVDGICLSLATWLWSFDHVIFPVLDDLLEIAHCHSPKDYRNMEGTLLLAVKLLSKIFLQLLQELSAVSSFCKLWLGVLSRMENYMKAKVTGRKSEKLRELIPELLKNMLLVMRESGILVMRSTVGGDDLWEQTWSHVNNIAPSMQSEVFPSQESEPEGNTKPKELGGVLQSDGTGSPLASVLTASSEVN